MKRTKLTLILLVSSVFIFFSCTSSSQVEKTMPEPSVVQEQEPVVVPVTEENVVVEPSGEVTPSVEPVTEVVKQEPAEGNEPSIKSETSTEPEPVSIEPEPKVEAVPSAVLTKTGSRMFWRIDGKDRNGKNSVAYLLGTIHVGTEEMYPLSAEVMDAWRKADRLVAETSADDTRRLNEEVLPAMVEESASIAAGRKAVDELPADCRMFFYNTFSIPQRETYNSLEPWYTFLSFELGPVMAAGFDEELGIDTWLTARAEEAGRKVGGLDSLDTTVSLIRFGSWEDQLVLAAEAVRSFINFDDTYNELLELIDLYLKDDVAGIGAVTDSDIGELEDPVLIRYSRCLYDERNESWAARIKDYLEEGGITFIYAGAAHFTARDSVFNIMKNNGWLK